MNMNIKKTFLTVSITHQILIVILSISFLCLFTILCLFTLYSNIIVNINVRNRREYYFNKYKEIIVSEIRFQTFLLYQYEQIIKGFNNQIYYFDKSSDDLYESTVNYQKDMVQNYKETTEEDYDPDLPDDKKCLFLLSFSDDAFMNSKIFYYLSSLHASIGNKLSVLRNFRIPYFGHEVQIINEYVFIFYADKSLYSINRTRIKEIEEISDGNIDQYYGDLIDYYVKKYKIIFDSFKRGEFFFLDIFFEDTFVIFNNYINNDFIIKNYYNNSKEYLNNISYYFHFIDYSTGRTFVTDNGNKKLSNFIHQNSIISDYINMIFFFALKNLDINVIPVFPENNTIMSVELCYAFLYKQMIILGMDSKKNNIDEEKLNQIYNKLKKGVSNIGDCILDKKYNIETNQNAYNILNIKFNKLYSIKNVREFSLFKLSDSLIGDDFMCIKYTFPDFSSILNFKPTFFTLEQLNLYCFKTFYEAKHYEKNMIALYENYQYMIALSILYLWIIIIIYNYYKLNKIYMEIVEPIKNLTEVIQHLDIKEENILKYEADDSINELFKLCNDLLIGKYKQKMIHDSEIDKGFDLIDNNKSDFNNLKINRKIIEEIIENKTDFDINKEEIKTFNVNETSNNRRSQINDNIKGLKDLRKTTKLIKKDFSENINKTMVGNIQKSVQKTQSIDYTIDVLNKKMSFDIKQMKKSEHFLLYEADQNNEDFLEMDILLNYKQLYDIIDLTFNYEIKFNQKLVSKNSKLLYKRRNRSLSKFNRLKSENLSNRMSSARDIIIYNDNNEDKSHKKETNPNSKIRIEEFDKSVIDAFQTKDMLFIWYKEAKYFNAVGFLQNNHNKELNNLYNVNIANDKSRISSKNILYSSITSNNTIKNGQILKKILKNKK